MRLRDYIHPDWFAPIDWWRAREDLDVPGVRRDGSLYDRRAWPPGGRLPILDTPIEQLLRKPPRRWQHRTPPRPLSPMNYRQIVNAPSEPTPMLEAIREMEDEMRDQLAEGEKWDAKAEARRRRGYDAQGMC